MLKRTTVEYIDSIFDLSLLTTQYALGNHDVRNSNMAYYREITARESYNVYSANGVVTICLNSQLNPSKCEELNNQFNMIRNVCDTISSSSFLFLIMHGSLFSELPVGQPSSYYNADYRNWNANCSSADAKFHNTIYPLLLDVKNKGVTVHCIMGDSGVNEKEFHSVSSDSINFFASGINNSSITDSLELANASKDKVLIFEYAKNLNEMSWGFHDLDSLFNEQ